MCSKNSRTVLNLSSCATTLSEEENPWLISAILRKMHKSIQTTRKSLNTSSHTLNGNTQNCCLLMNYLYPILNRVLFGIYCLVCLSYLLKSLRLLIKVRLKSSHSFVQRSLNRQENYQCRNSSS